MSARSKIVRDFSGQEVAIPYDPRDDAPQPEKNPNDHDRPHMFDVPGGMVGECLFWGCSERNPEEKITPAMHRAAPTMLEALLDITRWVDPDLDPLAGVILTKARAAIAAAEGRTDLTSGA
tara:strand:+ start:496 stop:858 length:363 start_codon:yes stop_codon:yes gene_type:complete